MSAAHYVVGNDDRARRAAARCSNSTLATGIACGGVVGGIYAAPVAAAGGVVAMYGAAGGIVGGAAGAFVGNSAQYGIEELYPEEDLDTVPGATEVHDKSARDWALDSVVGSVVGCVAHALIPACQQAARASMSAAKRAASVVDGDYEESQDEDAEEAEEVRARLCMKAAGEEEVTIHSDAGDGSGGNPEVPEVEFGGPTAAEAREFWESKEKVGTDNQQEFYIGSEPGSRRASREESAQPEAEPGSRRSSREENAQPEMLSY
eukprot:gnl/TRDRNA2_/TRDRNA2_163293_c1_seq2.p1 gnl/TRDRNA2_/TRDRNA2_163293_c1~~gnl/TRDRNA2_/TRDRNA2_163293_c1_seq2.p1  ORF type:complete len:279 (-),score=54.21 gnl/TRDRNA2_/TRDRNA2_163293_c1_seq2:149-937(-)